MAEEAYIVVSYRFHKVPDFIGFHVFYVEVLVVEGGYYVVYQNGLVVKYVVYDELGEKVAAILVRQEFEGHVVYFVHFFEFLGEVDEGGVGTHLEIDQRFLGADGHDIETFFLYFFLFFFY